MQESTEGLVASTIQLKPHKSDYKVERFSEKYANYKHDLGTKIFLFWFLIVIGGIITLVGVLTLLFGPSVVRYSLAGPTFFELIQLYPGPIASVGMLLLGIAPRIDRTELAPELYLLNTYELVLPDGVELSDTKITPEYLGGDNFLITIEPLPPSGASEELGATPVN